MKLPLTLACDDYDFLRPLREGLVRPEGIDLTLLTVESGLRHGRMAHDGAYDASEYSMGSYMTARSRGDETLTAIPFFPRRMFPHRFCFVRDGSGVTRPSDLKGKRVGILGYQNSLALVFKAILMHEHGLGLEDITWITPRPERVAIALPQGIVVRQPERGVSLEDLLAAGELDAIVQPDLPRAWLERAPNVSKLFPDDEQEEHDFYERTRIFPIMHPVVVKQSILERFPWVATSLFDALVASKAMYERIVEQPHRLSVVWNRATEERAFFEKDPFSQGFAANRHDIKTLIRFASEQHLLARPLDAEELFARATLGS